MMFQEMVNRIGVDVPGLPRSLRWVSPWVPLAAGPLPIMFFFGVLAGEVPIDHTQKNVLREGKCLFGETFARQSKSNDHSLLPSKGFGRPEGFHEQQIDR
jgi:P-aminobenzoate N-oxygenase AurF